jgi:nicotinate-nucleotide adenylyltransferase
LKIGIYGGTFDPIHIAHLIIAEFTCHELNLDTLYFVPSFIPPHKVSQDISAAKHRLNMLKLALADNELFDISTFELEKGGTSYTIDTLRHFREIYNVTQDNLYVLIGADNLADFSKWKDPDKIKAAAQIVVADRPNAHVDTAQYKDINFLQSPMLEISASMIRERVRQNKTVRYLTHAKVEAYIREQKLYI